MLVAAPAVWLEEPAIYHESVVRQLTLHLRQ